MMYKLPKGQTTDAERAILRKLRVWIAALAVACLMAGIGFGALLAGRPAVAQNEVAQIARTPEALSASFAEIAKRVEPAVVKIDTVSAAEPADRRSTDTEDQDESENPFFEMFRRRFPRRYAPRGVGSGFIVDPKGYILTNYHVVEDVNRINVLLESGEQLRGRVVGVDEETDLAVIKVDAAHDLPSVKLGDSDGVQVGDWVLAIGSPFKLDRTVTAGIISTKERRDTPRATPFQRFLQTDAAINRGNSGGPLVNMRGEVIGINSQIATSTGDYNGIGFALPAKEAAFVYRQLTTVGKVERGFLGIRLESVKGEFARVYELPEARGAIVSDVPDAQSPAAKAGIQVNDIILQLNNQPIIDAPDLINKVAATAPGQNVQLAYLRDMGGKLERRTANVVLGVRASRKSSASPGGEDSRSMPNSKDAPPSKIVPLTLGIDKLSEITPQLAADKNLKGLRGLLVEDVDPSSMAADAKLIEGDVIVRINRITVASLADFKRVVDKLKVGDPVVLNVMRNEGSGLVQRIVQFTYQ